MKRVAQVRGDREAPESTAKRRVRAKAPISERATLTIEEAARYLGIGRQTAYDEARSGGLPILRLGRHKKRIVVVRALLDEMILAKGRAAWKDAGPAAKILTPED
jgi:excisionase family DNA binding protein